MACCIALESLMKGVAGRGISVLVRKHRNGFQLRLQFRSLSLIDMRLLRKNPIPINNSFDVSIGGSIVIRFCPFCGTDLERLIESDYDKFNTLAQNHQYADHSDF